MITVKEFGDRIIDNCGKVIVGKEDLIKQVTIAFLCGGHVLLEDVPGTGKTMLARAFSKTIGGDFKRIQFTPDLLPSDLTGITFYDQKTCEFEFRRGPLFANMVLADEINRATPRTQSALLEAMEEHQISVDGNTYRLEEPFMVMATQNPIENFGTFPLPEAQMDRFFMRLCPGYMTREQEISVISRKSSAAVLNEIECVVSKDEIDVCKEAVLNVTVSADVCEYIMDIVEKTRKSSNLVSGASTRGGIALYKAAQCYAALEGRNFVIPEDVKKEAVPVLSHRLFSSSGSTKDSEKYLQTLLEEITVPLERL